MTDTVCAVDTIRPIEHDEAMDLADAEYERLLTLVDNLRDSDWSQPTDCIGWSVQDILRHLLGMLELQASPEELARQITEANERSARNGTVRLQELTALQVAEHTHLTPTELTAALHETAPLGLAARRALPPERRAQPYDSQLPGEQPWTVGHLFDIIHTRDPWVHRVDICRATGHPLVLTPEHDGRIIENVVADWAARHRQPFDLTLTGPAGRHFRAGTTDTPLVLDAVEFCRILSGREPGTGLLATHVVF